MAVIDPKKLLPETKTTSILVPKKNIEVASSNVTTKMLQPASKPESVGGKLVVKKLIKIDEVLKEQLLLKQSENRKEDKRKKEAKRDAREKKLETKKEKKKTANLFSIPKGFGGLDWLTNWLTFTLLGYLYNNFKEMLAYLKPIWNVAKTIGIVLFKVFEGIAKGVIFFIEAGYSAYESVKGLIGDLGGEDAEKTFEEATGAMTTALNAAIIAVMIAASTRPGGGTKPRGSGAGTQPRSRPGTGGRPKVTTTGGGRAGGSGLRNPLRRTPTVTSGSGVNRGAAAVGNRLTGRGAAKVTTGAAGKVGLRVAGRALKPILGRLPIVGGLLEFLISWAMGDPIGKAAFRGVGATLFAALGGIIGSVVPVFGTAIGAALGGFAGGEAGGMLYDVMFGNKKPKAKAEAKAEGGQVGATKTPGGRSVKKRKKKPVRVTKVRPTRTQPGKDFGDEESIQQFYGKDDGFLGTGLFADKNTPYDALVDSSKVAKRNKSLNGVVGSLIGTGIDLTLGQKPSNDQIREISRTLSTFVQASMQAEMDSTVTNIQQMFALENGGSIPQNRMIGRREEQNPVSMMRKQIERGITSSIQQTSAEIFSKIRIAMSGKKEADKAKAAAAAAANPSSYSGGGAGAQYGSPEMRALLDALAFAEGTLTNKNGATGPAGYSTWAGYQIHGPTDLTGLTIQEVHDLQTSFMNSSKVDLTGSAVVGRYQFKDLLAHFAPQAGLSGSDLFSPENQDKMAIAEINRVGITAKKLKEQGLTTQMINTLSPIWASFPKAGGGSVYPKQGAKDAETLKSYYKKRVGVQTQSSNPALGGGKVATGLKNWDNYGEIREGGRVHGGLDIAAPPGTPLTAVADGVFEEQNTERGWGQFVVYRVGGEYHLYAHLSRFAGKRKGQKIKAGEIIGYVGSTGRSTGPHLHWEMGNSWTGVIGGKRDPSKKYFWKLPFTVGRKAKTTSDPSQPPKAATKFTRSSINSFFGAKESFRKSKHEGIDIEAPQGTKISFSVGGTIIASYPTSSTANDSNGGYGAFVDLKLDNGKIIRMSHLSKIYPWVRSGAKFGPNEVVALSGGEPGTAGAGRSGGPHIHFEQHDMSGLGIEETLKNKVDPLQGGAFNYIQQGGSVRQNISSLSTIPSYADGQTTIVRQKEVVMVG